MRVVRWATLPRNTFWRGRQAVDRGRVVLGQVIRVEAGAVEALDLDQPLAVDLIESLSRHRLDVVEHSESQ